jgi:hypothetical protein
MPARLSNRERVKCRRINWHSRRLPFRAQMPLAAAPRSARRTPGSACPSRTCGLKAFR